MKIKTIYLVAAGMMLVAGQSSGQAPVITGPPTNVTAMYGSTALFNVSVSGPGPFTYQWLFNGTNLPNIITTVAGNGTNGFSGDGGPGTNASLNSPGGVTFDTLGNLFIADTGNNRVRKVDTNGTITTVAGKGTAFYSGDGGLATNANIHYPGGLAFDSSGNLFFADFGNQRVRKVDTNGIITTVAGQGTGGFSGDGGAATNASLESPSWVSLDISANFYISDVQNNRVRMVDTNGIITTVAGNGAFAFSGDGGPATNAGFYYPNGLAFDTSGDLFIADATHNRIRKVDVNGIVTTVAGTGATGFGGDFGNATNASMNLPQGLAFDFFGNLYIADHSNSRIRKVNTNGIITTVTGNGTFSYAGDGGPANLAYVNGPGDVACDAFGNLFISDYGNARIRKVNFHNQPTLTLAAVNLSNSGSYSLIVSNVYGSATSSVATLTVADPYIVTQPTNTAGPIFGNAAVSVSAVGAPPLKYQWYSREHGIWAGQTSSNLIFSVMNIQVAGGYYVVISNGFSRAVTSEVATLTVLDPFISQNPTNLNVSIGSNAVFTVGAIGSFPLTYQWYSLTGGLLEGSTGSALTLSAVTTNINGGYYVVVGNTYSQMATSAVATLTACFPPGLVTQPTNQVLQSGGTLTMNVAVSGTGPFNYQWLKDGVLVADTIDTVAGGGGWGFSGDGGAATNAALQIPVAVALDSFGNLYIADPANAHVRKVDTNGIISTIAGNGISAYSGDGGAATNASLSFPEGLVADAFGNVYVSDVNRIRKIDAGGVITTVAGNGTNGFSGDGGPATNASLNGLGGLAIDAAGSLFLTDYYNGRIRKVDTNGIITTVAGGGAGADGGAATNASLSFPSDVAVDAFANLYIADSGHARVRKVDPLGVIVTVAGKEFGCYDCPPGDGGFATNATFSEMTRIAVDGVGDLFVSDWNQNLVHKVNSEGIITAVTSGPSLGGYSGDGGPAINAYLNSPFGLATDAERNLYIADSHNARIRKVDLHNQPTLTLSAATSDYSGDYSVVVTSPYGSVTSVVASVVVYDLPFIEIQPVSQTNGIGGTTVFGAYYVDGTEPFTYQWLFNGTNFPGNESELTINNITTNNAGDYSLIITSPYGSVTSVVARLTVVDPYISAPPSDQSLPAGSDVVFAVEALGGSTLNYQWQWNGTNISGANSSSYTVPSAQCSNDGIYQVVVSDSAGTITSSGAMLTAVSASATLSIDTAGLTSGFRVGWSPVSPCDRLQTATNAAGPWIDAATQSNPQTNTTTGQAIFYQVISH